MKSDISLLYYTANKVENYLGNNVRKHLLKVNDNQYPIISVSQKPLDLGKNICVGNIGQSYYNCYKQILTGAKEVKTKYVAMCEDDTLYSKEHFSHRPTSENVFAYNKNKWFVEETEFWLHGWMGMCACIVATKYLIDTLSPRYIKYPDGGMVLNQKDFQEPGVRDYKFGIPNANVEQFETKIPILTFNFFHTLGGKKGSWYQKPTSKQNLAPWGNCWDLKKEFWGRAKKREECKPIYE